MPRRKRRQSGLPKGAYRLPNGDYVTERVIAGPEKRLTIVAVHRANPDLDLLAQALLDMVKRLNQADHDQQKKDS